MATYVVTPTPLYHSQICRLCGTENTEGIFLYDGDRDLKTIINKYLPIKIEDDCKLPRTICPGCHIQLAATKQFFDLIVEGQNNIRELWNQEVAFYKSLERERQLLEGALGGNSTIQLVADDQANDNHILIRVFPDEPFFNENHELALQVEGLKPRRKRGRPRKQKLPDGGEEPAPPPPPQVEATLEADALQDETKDEMEDIGDDENGRRRRRRKPPQRFMEAVAGKELDRILREEGAIDGYESDESFEEEANPHKEPRPEVFDLEAAETNPAVGEIIGHLTTPDGEIAEPIIAPPPGRGPYRKRRPTKFICDFCNQAFRDRTRWIRHRLMHKGWRFQCSDISCLETFTRRSKLNAHQALTSHQGMEIVDVEEDAIAMSNTPSEQEQLLCVACGHVSNSAGDLATHVENEHPLAKESLDILQPEIQLQEPKTDEQELINQGESQPAVLTPIADERPVMKGSSPGKHQCDECDRTFNHTSSLIYHKESCHNDGRRFVCSKCDKTFNHKQLLQRHQMVHSDSRPFSCPKCQMCFKTKSNLFNHRVVHTGEKKFSCESCGQQFAHKTSLNLHKSWHQGIRPYKCAFCLKCFTQSGNLREHLRIHNGEKPYRCNFCEKVFTTSSQHKLHVKRHTGDRPWKCQYCAKHFLHKDTWKTHERRHTGEKPFQCTYCLRAFAEHWSLKKHIRLHTGEKPYKCDTCGKEFADCSNLTKHKKSHIHTTTAAQSQVWNLIKNHLSDAPEAAEELKEVIFVTYQESDGKEDSQPQGENVRQRQSEEERAESQPMGQTMAFLDEEGNPLQLSLPDGRTVEILSLDMETNIVQVRTSEGWTILLQLPHNREIVEEEILEQIRIAVAETKPTERNWEPPVVNRTPPIEKQRPRSSVTQKLDDISGVFQTSQRPTNEGIELHLEDPAEIKDSDAMQQTFTLRLSKPLELVGDFEALKEGFLVSE